MEDTEKSKSNKDKSPTLSRRNFTKISLTAIAVAGVAAFLKKVTPPLGTWCTEFPINKLVHSAFRMTDHHSLLNLEFYFINCSYKEGGEIWAKYGPYENYMVVRLPQQHIAEQSFDDDNGVPYEAFTYISNYSYLVFRILFPENSFWENGKYTSIKVTKEELLDWKREDKFRLVVRQDLTESLFELCKPEYYNTPPNDIGLIDSLKKINPPIAIADSTELGKRLQNHLENRYPFQQKQKSTSHDSLKINIDTSIYDINRIPKVYGDPVTAIELPWRLIISPKLPDSSRFKFKWEFPETNLKDNGKYLLWTVTLSITERSDKEYINKKKAEAQKNEKDHQQASTGSLNDVINELELMILGSPDYKASNKQYDSILPTGAHRNDLVALYIKLKVLARTEKLTLSAIGATVKIHLKNEKIEEALKQGIGVIEWNQIISLGRDEKVEVSTLFLEAEFGHKMAYIQIAERQLKEGVYVLIKTPYIMPLDISRDYTNHITQTTDVKNKEGIPQMISRFNAPFKKITFLETKPKQLSGRFSQTELTQTQTSFQFEAIDWHDNIITFSKKINALPFGAVVVKDWLGKPENNEIKNIIEPVGDSMYSSNQKITPLADTSSIPLISNSILNDSFEHRDLTSLFVRQIDDSLKALRKHDSTIVSLTYAIQASNVSSSNSSNPSDDIDQLKSYFDDFFQFIKVRSQQLIQSSKVGFAKILEDISLNSFKIYLINKYLIANQDIFQNIPKQLEVVYKKLVLDFNVKKISDPAQAKDVFENVKTLFQDIGNKREIINVFQSNLNDSFFAILRKIEKHEIVENDKNNLFFSYYYELSTDFPEISKQIRILTGVFVNAETNLSLIVEQVKQKLSVIYQIEKIAENIPGLILLQKQKIGYAVKEKYDATRQKLINNLTEETKQVKKSLSELESEYIIFKGGLKQASNSAFDFFNEYAIIPQVKQAKVYVSALNKLVNEDLPISINYARDYIENQVRDAEFEVKQNASMVFAEVQQYSREQVKGLIQKIGDKMPGFNIEIPAHYLTYARNPNTKAIEQSLTNLTRDLGEQFNNQYGDTLRNYSRDLIFISEDVKNAVKVIDDLNNVDPKKYFKDLGAKLFGSIGLEDILDIGFDVPRLTELPDKLIYQVSTDKFKNFQAAFVVFKPNAKQGNPTRLELFVSKSLKNSQEYFSYTQLNNFSVGVVIGGTEVLTITFEQFKITSSSSQPKKTDVSITDVKLGGPLEFIADLAKKFMAPGNGMRIKPGPKNLTVDYTIALPDIKAPAFNFRNLQLVIGVNIPYDPSTLKAISFTFGVNKPEDKFLVSAGTYGGRGHFQLRATPKGIEQIDVAIELGAYASIDLGIGKGEVFLFFGFWFITGKDEGQNYIKAVAYVICAGSATVLGFITIGVSVLIALTYIKRGSASLFYGEAVVTYSVKIAFFKKEFSIRYYKEIAGSSKGNNTESLQTGAILLDASLPGGVGTSNDTDAKSFEDVFKNEAALEEYLSCFCIDRIFHS
ncbi:hypothetical protein BH10BAC3_BH10BAC3_12070 [soil metagenome]